MTARSEKAALLAWTTERLARGPDAEARAALAAATARLPEDAELALRHADALQLDGALDAAAAARGLALRVGPRQPLLSFQDRNFSPFTILSIVLRGPWTPIPTKSSASTGAAATAARLSASLVVVNIGSM